MRTFTMAGCAAVCFSAVTWCVAAVDGSEYQLGDMVVTATRGERAALDVPYATSLISADVLRLETTIRTLPEAIKYQPSTMVQKTSQGQGSPYIRGFTGYRTLLLIDGVRLNNSVFRDGPNQYWNTVDATGLARIETVRGPSSVLYGSDAVGGTVNALTRGASDLREESSWDRRLFYRFSSAEDSHTARLESIGRLSGNLVLTLGYTYKDFGDVEGGRDVGIQPKTGYGEQDWDAKLEYALAGGAQLILVHQNVDVDDAWRTHKTIYGIDWEGLSVGDELARVLDQHRQLTYLQYHDYAVDGWADEVHVGISRQVQEEDRDRRRTLARWDLQGFDVETLGGFVSLRSADAPIGDLVYGAEFYHDDVNSYAETLNPDGSVKSSAVQGPVADDATYDQFGIYIQDTLRPSANSEIILGTRYERAEADAPVVDDPLGGTMAVDGAWDDLVGSARALYYLDDTHSINVFGGISQGFRAPNLSDLTRLDTARTDEIETPVAELDPETFVSYEVGIKAGTGRFNGLLAYYYTDINDMIVRTPTGAIIDGDREVTKKNGGDGFVQGIELDLRARVWQALSAFGTFSWMDGEVDTYPTSDPVLVREPIDRLMPPTGRVGLRWDDPMGYWIEGSVTAAADADKLSTRDASDTSRIPPGGTPGYVVADLRGGYRFASGAAVSLAVENLTDEDYRIHGSGINEPGRNVIAALDWVF